MSSNIPVAPFVGAASPPAKRRRAWPAANALIGGSLLLVLIALAVLGLVWTPFDPLRIDLLSRLQGPSAMHWLGTDEFGRDVFSRLLIGARTSLWILARTGTARASMSPCNSSMRYGNGLTPLRCKTVTSMFLCNFFGSKHLTFNPNIPLTPNCVHNFSFNCIAQIESLHLRHR